MNMINEILEEKPFISYAASKVGVSRSTIYRWMEEEFAFKESAYESLDTGRKGLVDVAESKLMQLVNSGNLEAIKFLLRHNSGRYNLNNPEKEKVINLDDFGTRLI